LEPYVGINTALNSTSACPLSLSTTYGSKFFYFFFHHVQRITSRGARSQAALLHVATMNLCAERVARARGTAQPSVTISYDNIVVAMQLFGRVHENLRCHHVAVGASFIPERHSHPSTMSPMVLGLPCCCRIHAWNARFILKPLPQCFFMNRRTFWVVRYVSEIGVSSDIGSAC